MAEKKLLRKNPKPPDPEQPWRELGGSLGRLSIRKSPAGNIEFRVPPELENEYFNTPEAKKALAYTRLGTSTSMYRMNSDKPKVRTHERHHAGFTQLGKQPTNQQVAAAVGPYESLAVPAEVYMDYMDMSRPSNALDQTGKRAIEAPAYSFAELNNKPIFAERQQGAFDRYMNLLRELNPGPTGASPIEATAEPTLMWRYLTEGGMVRPPARPQIPMFPVDASFRSVLGK